MTNTPLLLLSNDDGIDAPGLQALGAALEPLGEVWVVAPDSERSTSSHSLSLRKPLAVEYRGERRFAVGGWPADCVYLGLFKLLPRPPALVVSGINRGPNLGTDVLYSGTVGAAREAFVRGFNALALSLVEGGDFDLAARFARQLVPHLLAWTGEACLLNVNVPGPTAKGVRVAPLGRRIYPTGVERCGQTDNGVPLYQIAPGRLADALLPGTDGLAVHEGFIAVTPLGLDSTDDTQQATATRAAEAAWERLTS